MTVVCWTEPQDLRFVDMLYTHVIEFEDFADQLFRCSCYITLL